MPLQRAEAELKGVTPRQLGESHCTEDGNNNESKKEIKKFPHGKSGKVKAFHCSLLYIRRARGCCLLLLCPQHV